MLVLIIIVGIMSLIALCLSIYACTRSGEKFTPPVQSGLSGAPLVLVDGDNLRTASLDDLIRTSPAIQDALGSDYVKYNSNIMVTNQDPQLSKADAPSFLNWSAGDNFFTDGRKYSVWATKKQSYLPPIQITKFSNN